MERLLAHRGELLAGEAVAQRAPGVHVLDRGDAQHAPVGVERVVLASRVVDVLEHLAAAHALGAAAVRAGGGEHLRELGAAVRLGDDLAAAAGLGVAVVGVLADQAHRPELHDDRARRLEPRVGLRVGERVTVRRIGVALEDGKREDAHEIGPAPPGRI
jgi:hypothetical protein